MNAQDDPVYDDGPADATECLVCGQPLAGRAYLALTAFAIVAPQGDSLFYAPETDVDELPPGATWADAPLDRAVHVRTCAQVWLDGLLVEVRQHRREAHAEGQGE